MQKLSEMDLTDRSAVAVAIILRRRLVRSLGAEIASLEEIAKRLDIEASGQLGLFALDESGVR